MVLRFRLRPSGLVFTGLSLGLLASTSFGADYFVSPTGRAAGDGTVSRPWDLRTALEQPSVVKPGDTIWLRSGTYSGAYDSYLTGTPEKPILLRQYPGERATIDGADSGGSILFVKGDYTWYWGFEIMSSHSVRFSRYAGQNPPDILRGVGVGFNNYAGAVVRGNKFINLIVHDTAEGYFCQASGRDSEIYGNIVYYNGWGAPDRPHGHGIYPRNTVGDKQIVDNIVFFQFGFGIHAWSDTPGALSGLYVEGNVVFDNGAFAGEARPAILVGGSDNCVAYNPRLVRNFTYCSGPSTALNNDLGYSAGCLGVQAWNNYFAAGSGTALRLSGSAAKVLGNEFIGSVEGFSESEFPWNVYHGDSRPTGVRVFVRPNRYEKGRAHIVVYNWNQQDNVEVDLSDYLPGGTAYEIRDAQNYFGQPLASGTYAGGTLILPMNLTNVAAPVGNDSSGEPLEPPNHTPREFGVFVLLPSAADDDADGVPEPLDVCADTPAPGGVDDEGIPLGDLDGDCDVDISDFAVFEQCVSGADDPPPPGCQLDGNPDLDGDGDVDLSDFGVFVQNYTGSR